MGILSVVSFMDFGRELSVEKGVWGVFQDLTLSILGELWVEGVLDDFVCYFFIGVWQVDEVEDIIGY